MVGSGYKLTISRDQEAYRALRAEAGGGWPNQIIAITALVKRRIRDAKYLTSTGSTLVYSLPQEKKSSYGSLLEDLESNKRALCITYIALAVTTLDEVYLKYGCIVIIFLLIIVIILF